MMKCKGSCVVAIIGSLLLLSPAFAQVKTPHPTRVSANENSKTSTRFRSETDKFEVLMPSEPAIKRETRVIGGQQLALTYYGTTREQSDYAVLTLAGLNERNWHVAHMLLLDFYSRSTGNSFRAVFQKDISLEGHAGRLFSLEAEGRIGEWRIYAGDKTLDDPKTFYAVAASTASSYTSSLRGYFDSFSLSPHGPTLASSESAVANTAANPGDRWLIILQTFSPHERSKADRRMNALRVRGYDAQVISTDTYAKLKPGLLALTMGPFSKRVAQERLGTLRSVAPQSYIKAGW